MCLPLLAAGGAAAGAAGGMSILGPIASLAGTAVSAMGAMQQANATAAASNYQAAVAHNNSIIAARQAEDARKRGLADEERQRMKTAQIIGRQKALMAANGVAITEGSPIDILGDTAAAGELDALTIRNTYEREAISHIAQSGNFVAEEQLAHMRAESAESAGKISAFGTILGGVGSFAQRWYGGSSLTPTQSATV